MSNVLDPSSVLHTLTQILSKEHADKNMPETLLRSNYDGLAAVSHAIMVTVGFRLVGLGDDDHRGEQLSITTSKSIADVMYS
jgi:hypothetical protein